MSSTTANFGIARPQDPPARVEAAKVEEPATDVQHGVRCMGVGLIGGFASLGGITMATNGLAQMGAIGLLTLSLLLCEFAYNALWSQPEDQR